MIALPTPILLLGIFSSALVGAYLWQLRNARRSREIDWSELVFRLRPAERDAVGKYASAYLSSEGSAPQHDADTMLEQLGGLSGLNAIYENSKVILALAGYVTRWNLEEGLAVTETIRHDAVQLQKIILRIRVAIYTRRFLRLHNSSLQHHLPKAAALYQQMSERLLDLYRNNHAGLYPQLSVVMRIC